jgi:hypothetical protein
VGACSRSQRLGTSAVRWKVSTKRSTGIIIIGRDQTEGGSRYLSQAARFVSASFVHHAGIHQGKPDEYAQRITSRRDRHR